MSRVRPQAACWFYGSCSRLSPLKGAFVIKEAGAGSPDTSYRQKIEHCVRLHSDSRTQRAHTTTRTHRCSGTCRRPRFLGPSVCKEIDFPGRPCSSKLTRRIMFRPFPGCVSLRQFLCAEKLLYLRVRSSRSAGEVIRWTLASGDADARRKMPRSFQHTSFSHVIWTGARRLSGKCRIWSPAERRPWSDTVLEPCKSSVAIALELPEIFRIFEESSSKR